MLEIIHTLSPQRISEIRSHLQWLDHHLTQDVSQYAPGRDRFWLNLEWDLKLKVFRPGIKDERLWNFCKRIYPECDLGLVAKGSIGIKWHRDDSYAAFPAVSINIGKIESWGYDRQYPFYEWVPRDQLLPSNPTYYKISDGDIIRFNCKNPHTAVNPVEDRYSINLWRVADRFRKMMPTEE